MAGTGSEQSMLNIAVPLLKRLLVTKKIHLKNVIEASVVPPWVAVE